MSLFERIEEFARKLLHRERLVSQRGASVATSSETPQGPFGAESPPEHADERTIRRVGEAQLGGMSSEESREAYLRGENPGGLHHGGKKPGS